MDVLSHFLLHLLTSVAPGELRVYLCMRISNQYKSAAQHSEIVLILLVSAHGKIHHWLRNAFNVCIRFDSEFISVGALNVYGTVDNAVDGWLPSNGISNSLAVFAAMDSIQSPKLSANHNTLVADSLNLDSFLRFWQSDTSCIRFPLSVVNFWFSASLSVSTRPPVTTLEQRGDSGWIEL